MNQDLGRRLDVVGHCSKIITFGMPENTTDHVFQTQRHHVFFELPLTMLLFAVFGS